MRNPEVPKAADYSLWDDADLGEPDSAMEVADALEPQVLTVGAKGAARLDKWLAEQLAQYSRVRLQHWIEAGAVTVDGRAARVRQALWADQVVRVTPLPSSEVRAFTPEVMPLSIVHEDEAILVLDKPAGLVVHPAAGHWSGTLLNGLLHHCPALARLPRAGIVHRLDKDTTGLMVVAKTIDAQTNLVRQLQARSVHREYLALVDGSPPESGVIDAEIGRHPYERTKMAALSPGTRGAKPALTHFRVLGSGQLGGRVVSLLALRLQTGRTHQIRVHVAERGWPMIGDPLYAPAHLRALFERQALHAMRLGLLHPHSGAAITWQIGLPSDLSRLLAMADLLPLLHGF